MNGSIVWLASYPKSGNTWFRAWLTNFLQPAKKAASINALISDPMAAARTPFDDALGFSATDLTLEEIEALRPEVYRHFAAMQGASGETGYRKIHDAYTYQPDGTPVIPLEVTRAAIYIVRNPMDVCLSLANHLGSTEYDRVIGDMAQPTCTNPKSAASGSTHLPIRLLSWSKHAQSWLDAPLRMHVVRYEDMVHAPEETLAGAVRFLELSAGGQAVAQAVDKSRFEELRRQEETMGFNENTVRGARFFNEGKVGLWRQRLTIGQVDRILAVQGETMRRLGYLDARGEPVF